MFGAGYSVVYQEQTTEPIVYNIGPGVQLTTGNRATGTISSGGDSSKPISVYAIQRTDNNLLSSAGLKINALGATANLSLGLDNIEISGSAIINNTLCTFGQRTDFSQMQIGYEFSYAVSWDKYTTTVEYINISVNMWYLLPLILPEALPFTVGPMLKSAFA